MCLSHKRLFFSSNKLLWRFRLEFYFNKRGLLKFHNNLSPLQDLPYLKRVFRNIKITCLKIEQKYLFDHLFCVCEKISKKLEFERFYTRNTHLVLPPLNNSFIILLLKAFRHSKNTTTCQFLGKTYYKARRCN